MHQKKIPRVKSILHSIPILHSSGCTTNNRSIIYKNKHLRYVSSSIPLACSVALLLLGICIVNPNSSSSFNSIAYATGEEVTDTPIPLADGDTTVGLELTTGSLTETTAASTGAVSYRSHNISYSVQNPMDYTLRVSYANGSNSLQYYGPNGTAVSTAGTTITGVGDGISSNDIPENSWGFAWSNDTSTTNEDMTYYTMPTNNNGTGISNGVLTSGTDSTEATGKLTFAAKFASDAIAGHYKTQVLLSLAAMPHTVVYQVTYDCKGGICPDNINDASSATSYTYTIPIASRAGYTFLGYNIVGNIDVADAKYAPGESITLTAEDSSIKLYAIWEGNSTSFPSSLTTMQTMTPDVCNSVKVKTSTTLQDSRDGSSYTIAKLDDGRCWMTQNLRIVNKTLTAADSDVTSNYTLPASSSPWSDSSMTTNKVHYANSTTNGAYYSWCATTAGSCNGAKNKNDVASASICPKGWRLPTDSEQINLLKTANFTNDEAGVTKMRGVPYNFSLPGYIHQGEIRSSGTYGSYWSSTAYDSQQADMLDISTSSSLFVYYGYNYRNRGFSVRCIAKNEYDNKTLSNITAMQEIRPSLCNNAKKGTTTVLTDLRDGNKYSVTRLDDGKCWMTSNLRITDKVLTPDYSNIATGYTVPVSSLWSNSGANIDLNKVYYNNDSTNGAYYTWCAATAERGAGCQNPGSTEALYGKATAEDICPRGWKLPDYGEMTTLAGMPSSWGTLDGVSGRTVGGGFFPAAGYVNGSIKDVGLEGFYWSDSSSNKNSTSNTAMYFQVNSDSARVTGSFRAYGRSVRCIAL